ncbi:glycosyltransferase [Xenorhabdus stockiae]|uniref:glycosyltransferase n=1 Tax=Xenorhabdus stockiae TaxID=351614 RepID=UPI004063B9DD
MIISVIIPCYNNTTQLLSTISSLDNQALKNKFELEVIIVDDGSNEPINIKSINCMHEVIIVSQRDEGFRVSLARNRGARIASGEILLFVDCGIYLEKNAVLSIIESSLYDKRCVSLGNIYGITNCNNHKEIILRDIESYGIEGALELYILNSTFPDPRVYYLSYYDMDMQKLRAPWVYCWGGVIAIHASLFDAISGFDESFKSWGGEDIELGIRLMKEGAIFSFVSKSVSIHTPQPEDIVSKSKSNFNAFEYIHSKHLLDETYLLLQYEYWGIEEILRQRSVLRRIK